MRTINITSYQSSVISELIRKRIVELEEEMMTKTEMCKRDNIKFSINFFKEMRREFK